MAGSVFPHRLGLGMGPLPVLRGSLGHVMGPEFCLFQMEQNRRPRSRGILLAPVTGRPVKVEFWSSHVSGGLWWTRRCVRVGRLRMDTIHDAVLRAPTLVGQIQADHVREVSLEHEIGRASCRERV